MWSKWVKSRFSSKNLAYNKGFGRTQIWIISLQSGLGRQILKLTPILMCSLKSMGKNLQNELWARPVPSKLSERRPPTLFLGADTENGEKRVLFRISANYSNANFFKRYPGYAIGKLTSRAFWKCGVFCCYNFLNRSYGCSKSTESEIWAMLAKIIRLQFCV